MRKYACYIAICSLLLTACKKTTTEFGAGMTAQVNATSWNAASYHFSIDSSDPSKPFLLIIGYMGSDSTGTNISLGVDSFYGRTGSYTIIGTTGNNGAEYDDHSINAWHLANTGTITITKYTHVNIEGTFSFATDNPNIANGRFNVPHK